MHYEAIEGYRLSPQQKYVWLMQKAGPVFRSQCAVLLEGDICPDLFKNSFQKVVRRHEILRTVFRCLPGVDIPIQVITEDAVLNYQEIDLTHCAADDQEAVIDKHLYEQRCVPLDFENGPLLLCRLLKFSSLRRILLLSIPSLSGDWQTLKILIGELARIYGAGREGELHFNDTVEYADSSEWLNELLEEQSGGPGIEFWRQHSHSETPSPELPLEGNSGTTAQFTPAVFRHQVDANQIAELEAIARKYESSFPAMLLACWGTLVWKLTKQPDIVVDHFCDGRTLEDLREAVGLYGKYLPVTCHFDETLEFGEILSRINRSIQSGVARQEYFPGKQSANSIEMGLSAPYLSIQFEYQEWPETLDAADARFSFRRLYSCIDGFKIKLLSIRSSDALNLEFHYDTNLFSPNDIERLAVRYATLLESVAANPEAQIAELEIMGQSERRQLLSEWNNTNRDYQRNCCLNELFEAQVEQNPDFIAVAFDGRQLSYRELNHRADQLADYLRHVGAGPETFVGLCIRPAVEMIVGLMGILKSGAAYLPLDPSHPKERLSLMLGDAQVAILLTEEHLVASLPAECAHIICLDREWETITGHHKRTTPARALPEHLAYVVYTSGSSGKPKAVMVQHYSLMNLVAALNEVIYQHLGSQLHVALNAPLVFDASVKQVVQLLGGHTLCILPEDVRLDPDRLFHHLKSQNVDVLDCTPSQFQLWLASERVDVSKTLPPVILMGGEMIDHQLWALLAGDPDRRFYNLYGPTECTVDSTISPVRGEHKRSTIGRPIPNARVYLLDGRLDPVSIGVTGEMYIAGAGLSRGYLNRPDLTAEKFIPDPFGFEAGARLYRTGDLACYLTDGNIEYRGRADNQIKLQGLRIELGEIEQVLLEHPGVRKACVQARQDTAGSKFLVGYIVPKRRNEPAGSTRPGQLSRNGKAIEHDNGDDIEYSPQDLRNFLRVKLPEHMVPASYVLLNELPLTRNGKINIKALPSPDSFTASPNVTYTPPQSQLEKTIALIWQQALKVERVGLHDNFFDLGGNSLLVAHVHSKLRESVSAELSMIDIFQHPTVNSLAKFLRQEEGANNLIDEAEHRAKKLKSAINRQIRR